MQTTVISNPTFKVKHILLIRRIDELKSNWYVWECDAELVDGTLVRGDVEADYGGTLISVGSFRPC